MYDFGHYIPFLGAFFGINVLFGAWDGVYGKLYNEGSTKAKKDEKNWEKSAATLDIPTDEKNAFGKRRHWNKRFREWIKTGGRLIGRTIAGIIAFAFFLVSKETPIPVWLAGAIALAAILPVLALFLMWLNNRGLKKIRHKENELYREAGERKGKMLSDQDGLTTAEEKIRQTIPPPP